MSERFQVRPDPHGYSVVDASIGEKVVIGMEPQAGLSREDAELNQRGGAGEGLATVSR